MKLKYTLLFGVIYTIIYIFLAIASINPEGTGPAVFFSPLITWAFLFVALYLLHSLESLRSRIIFIAFMLSHYVISLLFLYIFGNWSYNGQSRLTRMWERDSNFILFTLVWYLTGQIVIWVIFFKIIKNRERELLK